VKRSIFKHFITLIVVCAPLSAFAAPGLCERLLVDGTLRAAYYEIPMINNDDAPGVGDVIVIRDGNGEGKYDPSKPELGEGGNETGNKQPDPKRPEVFEEPQLEIVVPDRIERKERERRERERLPAILPLVWPTKKPTKPLPN
jgi:hypothetical protein